MAGMRIAAVLALLVLLCSAVCGAENAAEPECNVEYEVVSPYAHPPVDPAREAIEKSDLAALKAVLAEHPERARAKDDLGDTLLHRAVSVQKPSVAIVKLLLAKGADPNAANSDGTTPLHGHLMRAGATTEIAGLLISKGAKLDTRDREGNTPLHAFAGHGNGNTDLLSLLISKGANIHGRSHLGYTPLYCAVARHGPRLPIVKALIEAGAKVNADSAGSPPPLNAASKSSLPVVRLLIENGASVNAKDSTGDTPLIEAITSARPREVIEYLLAKGADLNAAGENGYTPLMRALFMEGVASTHLPEMLIARGADIRATDASGATVLMHAVQDPATAQLLLGKGVDVNATDKSGQSALNSAAQALNADDVFSGKPPSKEAIRARMNLIKALIEKGADTNNKGGMQGYTPLHHAVTANNSELVELLLAHGARIDEKSVGGQTPLELARGEVPSKDMVPLLLEKGAKGPYSLSMVNHPAAVRTLIAKGADVNARDKDARTALFFAPYGALFGAASSEEILDSEECTGCGDDSEFCLPKKATDFCTELTRSLTGAGADVNARDKHGRTPMHYWVGTGSIALLLGTEEELREGDGWVGIAVMASLYGETAAATLIEAGADVNTVDNDGRAPLHYVSRADMAEMLVSKGAKVNTRAKDGSTPLLVAALGLNCERSDVTPVARVLIRAGAEVNAADNKGRTCLHYAAESGRDTLIELLLSKGADPNARDKDGKTPLDWAPNDEHTRDLLKNRGGSDG